jgi:hypothetical protein
MTDKARIKIAATVTALFLAAVSVAGIATHTATPKAASTAAVAAAVQPAAAPAVAQPAQAHEEGEQDE